VLSISSFGDHFYCPVLALKVANGARDVTAPTTSVVVLDLIVGENWLVTVAEESSVFLTIRARYRGENHIGRLSAGTLAASLLDWHLTEYLGALQVFEG
jgi:hypothetical protein